MEIPVYNVNGEVTKNTEISDYVFAAPFNEAVVHQVLIAQQANARQGTASTKTRGEVAGSTRKLFRQKHTGMARAGSRQSPIRRGGGIAFGPKPRSYRQAIPKKMRRLALRCVLSAKVRDGEFQILEQLNFDEPKTKHMVKILAALGVDSSTLIAIVEPKENLVKSARNLSGIKTIPANLLSVVDVLSYRRLLMTEEAVRTAEKLWGKGISQGESSASI